LHLRGNTETPAPERACQIINATLAISPDESLRMELDTIVDLGKTESTPESDFAFLLGGKNTREELRGPPSERVVHAL